jgi:hypothetical protein
LVIGTEVSPDGENAASRIYLGVHWIMDQQDGVTLGHNIAEYVHANAFAAVPEPGTLGLAGIALAGVAVIVVRRRSR